MTFYDQSRYNRLFHQVIHKGGGPEINYIKIFQNSKALAILLGNGYSGDQLMQNVLDNFHQRGKYSDQIPSHQVEFRIEVNLGDQKSLSVSDLQIDYLILNNSFISERSNFPQSRWSHCGGSHPTEKCI